MTKPTTETRTLSLIHIAATGALIAVLSNAGTPWWAYAGMFAWGMLTGAWGFSAGWDARQ